MPTNIQVVIERMRREYLAYPRPFLAWVCEVHGISVRAFAEIFGISKSHAAEVINHEKFPSLELAVRISRYFEVTVEDLFAWRIDDDGSRRPLLVELPGLGMVRLKDDPRRQVGHDAIPLAHKVVECLREGKVFELEASKYTRLTELKGKGLERFYGKSS